MTWSDAPQAPAAPTRVGRARALEVDSEPTIPLAVPDVGERLSERVTQDQRLIIPSHPRRDAAGKHVAVGGHVAQGPRPLAPGPRPRAGRFPLETDERGSQPRRAERQAELMRERLGLSEQFLLSPLQAAVERVLGGGESEPVEDGTVPGNLIDAHVTRPADL